MNEQNGLYKTLRIKDVVNETTSFKTIVFEEGHLISYQAGQYLTLVGTIAGEEVRRSYSITSSPVVNEPLSIGVKRVENGGFSRKLVDHAKPGDEVITTGSGGFFVLPESVYDLRQLFFFAAGSGITPILSLLKTALHQYPHLSVVLVYSNAAVDKAVYLSTLVALQEQFGERFHLETLFSDAHDLSKARLHRDLILLYLQQYVGTTMEKTYFYICGPESYMRLCTYTLQEAGILSEHIKKENFFFHDVARRDAIPPDKDDHLVSIQLNGFKHNVLVRHPDAILKAARKTGLHLPYSCEAGRCGNCVARCIKGSVWHSYNEVLTDKELAKGFVLTCVGHPVGGDVVLEI